MTNRSVNNQITPNLGLMLFLGKISMKTAGDKLKKLLGFRPIQHLQESCNFDTITHQETIKSKSFA